jgi:hypothetical protein
MIFAFLYRAKLANLLAVGVAPYNVDKKIRRKKNLESLRKRAM